MKKHVVITIGCECGAGGPVIGKMIADSLGIEYFDRDFIDQVVEQAGVSKDVIQKANEAKAVKGRGPGICFVSASSSTVLCRRKVC